MIKKHLVKIIAISFTVFGVSTQALAAPPPRHVSLACSPLPYSFNCSIPRTANPQYSAHCWYRANGESYLMRRDQNFGFYNDIVELKIRDSLSVSGQVREVRTGRVATCSQSSSFEPFGEEYESDYEDEYIEVE